MNAAVYQPLMRNEDKPKDYFEGTLQIRGGDEELLDWIRKTIKKDNRAWIAKEKKVKGGIDLYLSDQKYLQKLGRKLKEVFPGILKTSRKLHTQSKTTSKLLYRVNVMFRPIKYRKGDKIKYQGEEWEIIRLSDKAHLKDPVSGKKMIVDLDKLVR